MLKIVVLRNPKMAIAILAQGKSLELERAAQRLLLVTDSQ